MKNFVNRFTFAKVMMRQQDRNRLKHVLGELGVCDMSVRSDWRAFVDLDSADLYLSSLSDGA